MTISKLSRNMKAAGYEKESGRYFSHEELCTVSYTVYSKAGKEAMEVKNVNGAWAVDFIHPDFTAEMARMGLAVGTVLD